MERADKPAGRVHDGLDGIADGSVTLAVRRWKRARVRPGTRLRTAVGVLAIDAVALVWPEDITEEDARRAGYTSRGALLAELDRRGDDPIHRVELRHAGPDPRIALRARSNLTDAECEEIAARLARLDARSGHGPWTRAYLELIRERPETRAADLAAGLGRETQPFKRDVRKLKELGLTESLERGYRLSPRGRALLDRHASQADGPQRVPPP